MANTCPFFYQAAFVNIKPRYNAREARAGGSGVASLKAGNNGAVVRNYFIGHCQSCICLRKCHGLKKTGRGGVRVSSFMVFSSSTNVKISLALLAFAYILPLQL